MAQENLKPDGTFNFAGGQNSAVDPGLIKSNQIAIGVNVSAKKGTLTPRWAITQKPLDFSLTGNHTRETGFEIPFESVFENGKFQAFIPYSIGPDSYYIYIVSGFIFLINLSTYAVTVLNPTDQVNVNADRINWSNAGQYLVVFDWPNRPFILDGVLIHRSDPTLDEVPVSVLGAYNQNRLAIANAGIDWTAGDPSGSLAAPMAPVTFIEVIQPSTGFTGDVYQLPTANKNNDHITAMGALQVLDTSTGIGSLFVATQNAVYSYPTYLPRTAWQGGSSSQVFGSLLLRTGMAGQRGHVNVNSDMHYQGYDGQIYSFTVSREQQYRWSNYPISREVSNFLIFSDQSLVKFTAASFFDNKIFFTANPYRVLCSSSEGVQQFDYVCGGMVVVEADNMAQLQADNPPAWAGLWTAIEFTDISQNNGKFYASGKSLGKNGLFMFEPDKKTDFINGRKYQIRSVIYTKEYDNEQPTLNKQLLNVELSLTRMAGEVKVSADLRPGTTENFYHYKDMTFNAPIEQCGDFPFYGGGLAKQGYRDISLGSPDQQACVLSDNTLAYWYKGMQVRLVITGDDWELKYIKLNSTIELQQLEPYCDTMTGVKIPLECFNLWELPANRNC